MPTNFTSKLVKIQAGNYRLDIFANYSDYTNKNGCFSPSFNICRTALGWTVRGDSTLLDPFHEDTLGAARTLIEHQIDHLLNPGLLNVQGVTFARNSGGFVVYTATYTAKSGVKYPIYIERPPQPIAKYTARCLMPQGGELRAEGIFASHACWNLTDVIDELERMQAEALDKIAPTTPVQTVDEPLGVTSSNPPGSQPFDNASSPVDLSWLADDPAPRTDGAYGEYLAALNELKESRSDLSVKGEQRWLDAFQRSIILRLQIVAQESRVVA